MAKLNRKQIQDRAHELLEQSPNGLRWGRILNEIHLSEPETPPNSIHGAIQNLFTSSEEIVKVARGTYRLRKYVEEDAIDSLAAEEALTEESVVADTAGVGKVNVTEQGFYASFAEWLVENDEATVAVELGGSSLGGKWGTPDVLGVLKPRAQDIFRFEPQIVSAEIKATPSQPVVAFGQAVAYRLFSHKSYIVVPCTTSEDDMARLKALCSIHGVGLITFTLNIDAPDYTIIVLAVQANPDMFYVNTMLKRLEATSPSILNRLF
jgi:hypothetical protein